MRHSRQLTMLIRLFNLESRVHPPVSSFSPFPGSSGSKVSLRLLDYRRRCAAATCPFADVRWVHASRGNVRILSEKGGVSERRVRGSMAMKAGLFV